jgi:hypothetical protein
MKTTREIPDAVFRRAKSKAPAQGVPLRQFESFLDDSTVLDVNQETTRPYATVVVASGKSASRFPATISGSLRFVASTYSHLSLATAISTSQRIFSASLGNLR